MLAILHGSEKFHYHCFTREVSVVTDHKPLVAILKKIWQHYHRDYSAYYSGSINTEYFIQTWTDLFIADLQSQGRNKENKDDKIMGMKIHMHAINTAMDIPKYMNIHEIQPAAIKDDHPQQL